jgi:hypothetical protein
MPLATYRSFLGLAKDASATTLAAAVASGATTVTIVGTGVPASSTIFIWDGPLSESRAVTAGGGTSTLTVAALTNAHPAGVYITSQLTASVGPTDYIPVTSIEPEDMYAPLEDKGYRGSVGDVYNFIQGPAHSEFSLAGDVFADTIGYFIGGVLGATDFTGGTPNTHAFSAKNTGDTQPTAFTLYDFDAATCRAYAQSRFSDVSFKFNNEGLLTWTAKATGVASGIVATPTVSFSTVAPLATWIGVVTIGGTVVTTLVDADLGIKRPVLAIQTLDSTQHPYKIWSSAPVSVDGKLTFVMEDETELLRMLNNTQPSLDILFSTGTGASQQQIQFHCTKVAYRTAKVNRGQDYVQLDVAYQGVANVTDATTAGTGYSPIKVTTKNTKATGTYL